MDKELEQYLWDRVPDSGNVGKQPYVRDVIAEMLNKNMIKSPKQAWATLEKWTNKGIYEYGCVLDMGWKVPK